MLRASRLVLDGMNWRRCVYTLLLYALVPLAVVRLFWRSLKQPGYRRHVAERFGFYTTPTTTPLLWLHSVSVGETRAAEPLVKALRQRWPDHRILLTHMTPTGRETGIQVFGDTIDRCYLPYDLPDAVSRFLAYYRPRLGVLLETEIWPNLIHACHVRDMPLYLVNARLSERSARGYAQVALFTAQTLRELAGVAAQSEADARRLSELGARRVEVCGNLKFDRSPKPQELELGAQFRAWFGARPVFLAASTREDEELQVLEAAALAAVPDLLTVIVPRHPQRFDTVANLLQERGIAFQRRSAPGPVQAQTEVWLGDSLGEMFAFYAACDVAFVGGSLLPLGGQNPLEACAVGKPVLLGPHTFNFEEATRLAVEAGAALQFANAEALGHAIASVLKHPEQRQAMGEAGLALMQKHQGAAQRIIAVIEKLAAGKMMK